MKDKLTHVSAFSFEEYASALSWGKHDTVVA